MGQRIKASLNGNRHPRSHTIRFLYARLHWPSGQIAHRSSGPVTVEWQSAEVAFP